MSNLTEMGVAYPLGERAQPASRRSMPTAYRPDESSLYETHGGPPGNGGSWLSIVRRS